MQLFISHFDEKISDHVGIKEIIFDVNCWVWMITRAKYKQGEGTLKTFNLKVSHASRRKKMAKEDKRDEHEENFHMVFYHMSEMVEWMYGDYEKRMKKKEKKKE